MAEHIQVYNPSNGQPYATAPTPKNGDGTININDNSTKVATTEWVKTTVVNKAATETISGTKTFTSSPEVCFNEPRIFFVHPGITKGTPPSDKSQFLEIMCADSNGHDKQSNFIGALGTSYNIDGSISSYLSALKPEAGSIEQVELYLIYPASGYPFAACPTPKDSSGNIDTTDNSNKIATTEWVNRACVRTVNGYTPDAMGNVNNIITRGDGYIRFTNGIQFCWGSSIVQSSIGSITYPLAFTYPPIININVFGNELDQYVCNTRVGNNTTTYFNYGSWVSTNNGSITGNNSSFYWTAFGFWS